MKKLTILAVATGFVGASIMPNETLAQPYDWTGFYGGVELGYAKIYRAFTTMQFIPGDSGGFARNLNFNENGHIYGFTTGYDYEFDNNFVVGAGADFDFVSGISIPRLIPFGPLMRPGIAENTVDIEKIFRAKLRGGYAIGRGLLYATGGYAWADTKSSGSDYGYFIGGGVEFRVSKKFSIGAEALYHDFNKFNNNSSNTTVTTIQLRGLFRLN